MAAFWRCRWCEFEAPGPSDLLEHAKAEHNAEHCALLHRQMTPLSAAMRVCELCGAVGKYRAGDCPACHGTGESRRGEIYG